jgi:DNA primase
MPLLSVPGACKYLTSRKFDPEELEVKWGVMATGPGAVLKLGDRTVDFSYRVIIPVYYKGKMVSYQGRDWTGRNSPKYLSCPNAIEGMPIKSTVYGLDECQERQAVVVEGAFDVWRIGPGAAVALFGIKHRLSQIKLMVERFDHITMLFDPEPRAKLQALSVARALESCGVGVRMIVLPSGDKDPADMSKDELRGVLK